MLAFDDALQLLLNTTASLETETVSIHEAFNRTLAQPIHADRNYPPFNRAAMDGYAIKWTDAKDGISLKVIGELHAGHTTTAVVSEGTCLKIMTGAATPPSADLIVRVEDSERDGEEVKLFFPKPPRNGQNLAKQGEDVQARQLLLEKGTRCTHDILGLLAVTGHAQVLVYKQPTVAIISTGDELKAVGEDVLPHQIRNSNEFTIKGLLAYLGIRPSFVTHVPDNKEAIEAAINQGLECDVLMLSGGVSMGDADYVPQLLKKSGVQQLFHRIAIKPGKPIWFGNHPERGTAVFGLPGNPLSCQVTFKLLVERYLGKALGWKHQLIKLPLAQDKTKKHPLDEFFVCFLNEHGEIVPKRYNGSGDITSSVATTGIARHPAASKTIQKGDYLEYRPWK